jgi:hypothetical protein
VDEVLGIGQIPTDVRAMDCDVYAAGKAVQLVPLFGAIA